MAIDINIPSQVRTFANLAAFPATGALKTIYIAEDTNKTYRWTGSVYVEVSAAGATGITIGTTAITSGTVGRVLFEGTGNVVQESANLFWDNTNGRLGIGTAAPAFRLEVQGGDVRFANGLTIGTAGSTGWQFSSNTLTIIQNGFLGVDVANGREFSITNTAFSTTYFKIAATTGNVLINTTTDAGFRLDVNGNTRINGDITAIRVVSSILRDGNNNAYINNSLINIATTNLAIGGTTVQDFTFTTKTSGGKYVFNNANVLINTTTDAGFKLDVNGTARISGNINSISTGLLTHSFFGATGYYALIGTSSSSGGYAEIYRPTSTKTLSINNGDFDLNLGVKFNYTGLFGILIKGATGNVLINTATDVASSQLTIDSTTKGFLPPRMTTTQKNAIATPAAGLVVYDTTLNKLCVYTTTWETITSI